MSLPNATGLNATSATTSPNETAALIVAIVQSIIFFLLGPAVLLYGRVVQVAVIFVQAVFAANYLVFIGDLTAITALTAFDVFGRLVGVVTATLTLTFTAIRSETANNAAQGAVLGALISLPLLQWLRDVMFVSWVGCSGFGEKTPTFPDGEPLDCDLNSSEFQVAFQLTKALVWISTLGTAIVGKHVTTLALCMTGSTMLINGVVDLTKRICIIAMPDDAETITLTVEPIRAFVGYGLAAVGVLVQRQIVKPKGDAKERGMDLLKQPSEVASCLHCLLSPFVIKCLLGPVLAFNTFLNKMEDEEQSTEDMEPRKEGEGDLTPLVDATPSMDSIGLGDSSDALPSAASGECTSMAASAAKKAEKAAALAITSILGADEEEGEDTTEEDYRRLQWIAYNVSAGQYDEAEDIGWDRRNPPDPRGPPPRLPRAALQADNQRGSAGPPRPARPRGRARTPACPRDAPGRAPPPVPSALHPRRCNPPKLELPPSSQACVRSRPPRGRES